MISIDYDLINEKRIESKDDAPPSTPGNALYFGGLKNHFRNSYFKNTTTQVVKVKFTYYIYWLHRISRCGNQYINIYEFIYILFAFKRNSNDDLVVFTIYFPIMTFYFLGGHMRFVYGKSF
jgi:hypothetical protein